MNKPTSKLDNQQAAKNKLTPKQKIFVQHLIDNPTASATAAAKIAYPNQTYATQRQQAMDNMTKPSIIMALGQANDLFESTIVGVVKDWGQSENTRQREIALDAAKYGHDKVHGKATTKLESTSQSVNVNIDLSSA